MKSPRQQIEEALAGGGTLRIGGRIVIGARAAAHPRRYSTRRDPVKFVRPGGAKVIVTAEDCLP